MKTYSLILDSSNKNLMVALAIDGKLVENVCYEAWQRQSELMIPEIENVLKKQNLKAKDINEILVTKGPGSYTGLRIALTIAKIYGTTLGTKVYAFSALKAQSKRDVHSICLINARSGRSYFGVYLNNEIIEEDCVLTNQEILDYIQMHQDYVVCGDTEYLNLEGYVGNMAERLLELKNEEDEVENILALKAVYLKD